MIIGARRCASGFDGTEECRYFDSLASSDDPFSGEVVAHVLDDCKGVALEAHVIFLMNCIGSCACGKKTDWLDPDPDEQGLALGKLIDDTVKFITNPLLGSDGLSDRWKVVKCPSVFGHQQYHTKKVNDYGEENETEEEWEEREWAEYLFTNKKKQERKRRENHWFMP